MSASYCPTCDGDPRRRENVEPHKLHESQALPDDSEEDWLDIPDTETLNHAAPA